MLAVRTTSLWLALIAFVIVLCTPAQLTGQDSATGSLRGTVVDPTGARVMQASIVVVNDGTGARYTAISDGEGHFAIELLPPGDYFPRVEAQGMSPQITPQLHVDVGVDAALTFRLKIAGALRKASPCPARQLWSKLNPAPSPRCSTNVRLTNFR